LVKRDHYEILKEELGDRDNVSFMLVSGKGHNPNYTKEAVGLLGEFGKARTKLLKNKKATKEDKERFIKSLDWKKMTEQDENVWKEIFEYLEK
jgi:hypothetical protein